MPLDSEHIALADIIRRRSRKAHYMAASSPGRMGIIRGIASIASDYADTLPNGQRDAFLSQCGHAAATVRGEYDRSPSFMHHKARETDPANVSTMLVQPGPCTVPGCDQQRRANRVLCNDHLAEHIAEMADNAAADRRQQARLPGLALVENLGNTAAPAAPRQDYDAD